jgi:hypothetical protein
VYALTTMVNNVGGTVSGSINAALLEYYGISLTNFTNLWKMTVIACSTTLFPILTIPLVPNRPVAATPGVRVTLIFVLFFENYYYAC